LDPLSKATQQNSGRRVEINIVVEEREDRKAINESSSEAKT